MRLSYKLAAALAATLVAATAGADSASAERLAQKLIVPGSQLFGFSVAVDGDTLVAGDPADANGTGAVYVYTRAGDTWTETAKLTATDGASGDVLGTSVAISGDAIVAGASGHEVGTNPAAGAVYIFARTGASARTQVAELTASDGAPSDSLGTSVAISGDTIIAGAPSAKVGTNDRAGAAYAFARFGPAPRTETAKLTAADGGTGDQLGTSVAASGTELVAGAPLHAVGVNAHQGAVYTFASVGAAARTQTAELTDSAGGAGQVLGTSVGVDADTIVAGAPGDTVRGNAAQGAVYTFTADGAAARTETARLTSSDGVAEDQLGASVAESGSTIVAGAPNHLVLVNAKQGAAYVFAATGGSARVETSRLVDADGPAGALLGLSVATDGSTTVAGAPLNGSALVSFQPAPPPPPPPPPPGAPLLSKLAISPGRIHASGAPRALRRVRISFTLSENASVALSLTRAEPGRVIRGTCRAFAGAARSRHACTRRLTIAHTILTGRLGSNSFPLAGLRVRSKSVVRGTYTITATPTDAAHHSGPVRSARLIVAR